MCMRMYFTSNVTVKYFNSFPLYRFVNCLVCSKNCGINII